MLFLCPTKSGRSAKLGYLNSNIFYKSNGCIIIGVNMAISKGKQVIVVDPELWMNRKLHYDEKRSGWQIFTSIYWSIFILVVGAMLIYYNTIGLTLYLFFGVVFFLFALMIIVYGFTASLHLKLMRRYG